VPPFVICPLPIPSTSVISGVISQTPSMLQLYTYAKCSTCQNAVKWLRARGVKFTEHAIRETPPAVEELAVMLRARGGEVRKLFNTTGMDYRALGLGEKLPALSTAEALALLAGNGNLVKRPFALDAKAGVFLTGFREAEWEAAFGAPAA
jgi:arsenate reductase (glutaredoxin)